VLSRFQGFRVSTTTMSSSPPLATAVPKLNATREFSSVSAAVPLLQYRSLQPRLQTGCGYVYMTLGVDLDCYPFTPFPEDGHEINGLDDKSELAQYLACGPSAPQRYQD
jgi:hypothetical protein